MKTANKLLIVLIGLISFFTSCDEEKETSMDNPLKIEASSNKATLVEEMADDVVVTFDWNTGNDRGEGTSLSYMFKMDVADNNFATSIPKEVMPEGVFSRSFTHEELNKLVTEYWKVKPGDSVDLEAKVIATVISPRFIKPEVSTVRVRVKSYQIAPKPLYLVGSATSAGMDPAKGILIEEAVPGKTYYWEGNLSVGSFKFITELGNILPSLNKGIDENTLVERTSEDQPDDLFTVTKAGLHALVIHREQMEIIHAHVPYRNVWMVGNATPAGWDINNPTPMVWNPDQPNVFTYEGPLYPGEMKLPLVIGNFGGDFLMPVVAGAGIDDERVQFVPGGSPDNKWVITQAGDYKVTLNTEKMTIKFELKQ